MNNMGIILGGLIILIFMSFMVNIVKNNENKIATCKETGGNFILLRRGKSSTYLTDTDGYVICFPNYP